jgi:hypothetical protein
LRGGLELLLMVLSFPKARDLLDDLNVWIADTAASCDSTPHSRGAVNVRRGNGGVIFGDGKNSDADEIFDLPGMITDQSGNEKLHATLQNVKHVRSAKFNLFSLTKRQKDSWLLNSNSEKIWITKGEHKIVFDIRIETPEGLIFTLYHKQKGDKVNAAGPEQAVKKLAIKKAHELLEHMNKDMCRATCKALCWELNQGTLGVCAACMVAKAKQKAITISKEEVKEQDGKTQVYLDISSIKKPKDIKAIYNQHCWILVDERTQLKFVDFYEKKSSMIEPTCEQFKKWEQNGHKVDVVWMDNGGENLKLENRPKATIGSWASLSKRLPKTHLSKTG